MAITERLNPPEIGQEKSNIVFGSYTPQRILTNQEIESWGIRTESGKFLTAEDILKKTGIEKRHVANDKETPLFMAIKASEAALKDNKGNIVGTPQVGAPGGEGEIVEGYTKLINEALSKIGK